MPEPTTVGGGGLSSLHVVSALAIEAAWLDGQPLQHATGLCDATGCDYRDALTAARDLRAWGWLLDDDAVALLRWDRRFPALDPDPARPSAEDRRHADDLWAQAWALDWLARGYVPLASTVQALGQGVVVGRARRDLLARMRDPSREGGAVWAAHGAMVPAWAMNPGGRRIAAWECD